MFVGAAIIIGEGEDFAGCLGRPVIAGGGESGGFEVEGADFLLLVQKFGCVIGRAVVDDNDFEVGIVDFLRGFEAGFDSAGTIAGADDDGEVGRVCGEWRREFKLTESGEGGFFRAITTKESEGPVIHDSTIVEPVVRPSVKGGSGESGGACGFEGGWEEGSL